MNCRIYNCTEGFYYKTKVMALKLVFLVCLGPSDTKLYTRTRKYGVN